MKIENVIERFNTTPILFVGSGITRRYYDLPDWEGLLSHFAQIVKGDEFAYSFYKSKAHMFECKAGILPKIAELIQQEYDLKWFSEPEIRTVGDESVALIKQGTSPFKAEVAHYIKENSKINAKYAEEIELLTSISEKSISGVITTNYDDFIERHFTGYTKFIGQNQLVFSALQGVAEIYKIHGSIEDPNSIVINEEDYLRFDDKRKYLAAKLMTIFMEYPIIFMGYSISDSNIQKIIKSIIDCLEEDQVKVLEDRFIFVEYKEEMVGAVVNPYTIMIDGRELSMKKIQLSDYRLLYKALEGKKAKLPVRILRRFKQELYDYTITNVPTANLRVASIDDNRVADEELVLAIGKVSDLGLKGLSGIDSNEWYRNIIIEDLDFTADDLLQYAFPVLIRQNSGRLPVNKYLSEATQTYKECEALAANQTFEGIISNTIRKNRKCLGEYNSVLQIWENEKDNLERATRLIAHLTEEQFVLDELESVLIEIFSENVNVLKEIKSSNARTNIRRLICIYDYLKWGK